MTTTTANTAAGPVLLNASIDGLGDVLTLYFDRALDSSRPPSSSMFVVNNPDAVTIKSLEVVNNQVVLRLAQPLNSGQAVKVSFADPTADNDQVTLQGTDGVDASSFTNVAIENRLVLTESKSESFGLASSLGGLAGAEISAFDKTSSRLFVTSPSGLQVVKVNANLALTLEGTLSFAGLALASNDVNSVASKNGLVAVAVAALDKTQPGKIYFIDPTKPVDSTMIVGEVTVGALPDMLTFSADGKTLLVANEAEQDTAGANPVGSVSIINLSSGPQAATVTTASFSDFDSQLAALKQEGVRLFAGSTSGALNFSNVTVSQDLEPEYISIAPDGLTAFVTLQENNAIAVLDITSGRFTDIIGLGLKSFNGLPIDTSDRDGTANATLTRLQTDQPVYGQYMPDAIASFKGLDGKTYFVIANEGDDRDDFLTPDETSRVGALTLDPTRFPDATALKTNAELARLTVSNAPGNNGDLDGDGDIDQLLMYGARSFSILNDDGVIVFDSGSHIEQFVAANGVFVEAAPATSGLFDDTRSDNKGPEPEGITIGVVDGKTMAFVALERGGGGVMVYDVTNPMQVSFVQYLRNPADVSPEGVLFIEAAQSPTGNELLVVSNEVSKSISIYQDKVAYTLQLLHFADGEAGLLAGDTAKHLAALVDKFEDEIANSITLAGGDNFLPGPFLAAGTDPSVIDELNKVNGSSIALNATVPIGAVDIAIHNAIGVEASTIGNHEFDLGSRVLRDVMGSAKFPYMSANLDFSGDSDLKSLFVDTTATAGLELAVNNKGKIVPSAVLEKGGEKIGMVAATTQLLESISSPSGTEVKGFPTGPGSNGERDDMDLLAAQLQPVINDLISQGVNKIILMAHLQVIANEKLLATKLSGVDIILSAGSNTRLGDSNDVAVPFPGHAADFADTYPLVLKDKDGKNTLLVNTDNEYTYLGRLVVDFDKDGNVLLETLGAKSDINGAVAATAQNVAEAWNTTVDQLGTTAFAAGTRGANVQMLTDAVDQVIDAKDGNVYGYSSVYLEGERATVRSEETNLGNLTADANAWVARQALGISPGTAPGTSPGIGIPYPYTPFIVSLKNGGGIRAQIGTLSNPDPIDGTVDKLPPDGGVSQLDVENSLRFNNQLMMFDTTPQGLKAILEHGVAAGVLQGRFPQIGGVAFAWDPDLPAGSRITDVALDNNGHRVNLYNEGVLLDDVPHLISVVTLGFLANGGDSYPIKLHGENFRYIINGPTPGTYQLTTAVDEAKDFTIAASVPNGATPLGEQAALEAYMRAVHPEDKPFADVDTPAALDERIQNLNARVAEVNTNDLGYVANDVILDANLGQAFVSGLTTEPIKLDHGNWFATGSGNDDLTGRQTVGETFVAGTGDNRIDGGGAGDSLASNFDFVDYQWVRGTAVSLTKGVSVTTGATTVIQPGITLRVGGSGADVVSPGRYQLQIGAASPVVIDATVGMTAAQLATEMMNRLKSAIKDMGTVITASGNQITATATAGSLALSTLESIRVFDGIDLRLSSQTADGGNVEGPSGTEPGLALRPDGGEDELVNIEGVSGSGYNDILLASDDGIPRAFGVALRGRAGDDAIAGGSGDDVLLGDDGQDAISGGHGNDLLGGGRGADRLRGGHGKDTFIVGIEQQFAANGSVSGLITDTIENLDLSSMLADLPGHVGRTNDRISFSFKPAEVLAQINAGLVAAGGTALDKQQMDALVNSDQMILSVRFVDASPTSESIDDFATRMQLMLSWRAGDGRPVPPAAPLIISEVQLAWDDPFAAVRGDAGFDPVAGNRGLFTLKPYLLPEQDVLSDLFRSVIEGDVNADTDELINILAGVQLERVGQIMDTTAVESVVGGRAGDIFVLSPNRVGGMANEKELGDVIVGGRGADRYEIRMRELDPEFYSGGTAKLGVATINDLGSRSGGNEQDALFIEGARDISDLDFSRTQLRAEGPGSTLTIKYEQFDASNQLHASGEVNLFNQFSQSQSQYRIEKLVVGAQADNPLAAAVKTYFLGVVQGSNEVAESQGSIGDRIVASAGRDSVLVGNESADDHFVIRVGMPAESGPSDLQEVWLSGWGGKDVITVEGVLAALGINQAPTSEQSGINVTSSADGYAELKLDLNGDDTTDLSLRFLDVMGSDISAALDADRIRWG